MMAVLCRNTVGGAVGCAKRPNCSHHRVDVREADGPSLTTAIMGMSHELQAASPAGTKALLRVLSTKTDDFASSFETKLSKGGARRWGRDMTD